MRDAYVADIEAIAGMQVFGRPDLSILGFGDPALDMVSVAAGMGDRGWVPGLLQDPPGLHMMMSLLHEPVRQHYTADLAAAARAARPAQAGPIRAEY